MTSLCVRPDVQVLSPICSSLLFTHSAIHVIAPGTGKVKEARSADVAGGWWKGGMVSEALGSLCAASDVRVLNSTF